MFVKDTRSKMLALFYFAIPVGSGMGYIVGSETAHLLVGDCSSFYFLYSCSYSYYIRSCPQGSWQWGLRATPVMGLVAVVLILVALTDPPR